MARRRYKGDPEPEAGDKPAVSAKEQQIARRWKRELMLAGKRERDWRKEGEKIYKRYRSDERKTSRYNVLWSNTDVLRPAIYNSKPDPDVRRRFRDADALGKAVGEVLERALYVMCDGDSTDDALKLDVLDALLPGRGVSRIVYIPQLAPAGDTNPTPAPDEAASTEDPEGGEVSGDTTGEEDFSGGGSEPVEPGEGTYEQVEDEQVEIQHVDWKDFRHGYGRTWPEVPWVGFRHELDRTDAVKKFGKPPLVGLKFTAQQPSEESTKKYHEESASVTKVAEFWEVWDKESGTVFFLQETIEQRLFPLENPQGKPPLSLEGFFPCPRPLLLVEDSETLIPTPIFRLYESEANQLDILSLRIDKIVKALRVRGVYDSKLIEIPDLLQGEDNDLTPVQNAQQWADAGGLDKAIAWMPIDQLVKVLEALYEARDRQKRIIDELTGIADIVRGVTDPDETLGAQQMKGGYFSVRLWRYQQEVKRYGRDLLRLAAQVMACKFGADTFAKMTDLTFPTNAQRALMQMRLQMLQQPPPMLSPPGGLPGQPAGGMPAPAAPPGVAPAAPGAPPVAAPHPPPAMGAPATPPGAQLPVVAPPGAPGAPPAGPPRPGAPPAPQPQANPMLAKLQAALTVPTWEQILAMMRSPALRQFRVDVETDSMIAGTIQADMAGLAQVLQAIAETMQGLAPLVQSGALPIEAAKELVMTIIRRARMGTAVEDAFDKLAAPAQPQGPQDNSVQVAQAQGQAKLAQTNIEEQAETARQKFAEMQESMREQFRENNRNHRESMLEITKGNREELLAKWDGLVRIITTTIAALKQPDPGAQAVADRAVAGENGALPAPGA